MPIKVRVGVGLLEEVMINFDNDDIEDYYELVSALDNLKFHSKRKRMELNMKNQDSPHAKFSIGQYPTFDLKDLPSILRYVL